MISKGESMPSQTDLYAFYLPRPLSVADIQARLGITLKKKIEATYYARVDDAIIIFTQFDVLSFINTPVDLHLLDKPNILWDNKDAEALYNTLAAALELRERFEIVSYKLESIKDDIVMVTDLTNHQHSAFLEWIIIALIGVEIGMGLIEWFKPAFLR